MFEQQMSQSIEAGAPDITYSGNEGPKSPQQEQQMMMAQLEQEYSRYVFEMEEQGIQPMTLRQFIEQAMAEGQMSSAQPMAPRQMAAYGGIMGLDGRRKYGLGSKFKKFVRKIIPNEVAKIAEVAAPTRYATRGAVRASARPPSSSPSTWRQAAMTRPSSSITTRARRSTSAPIASGLVPTAARSISRVRYR